MTACGADRIAEKIGYFWVPKRGQKGWFFGRFPVKWVKNPGKTPWTLAETVKTAKRILPNGLAEEIGYFLAIF